MKKIVLTEAQAVQVRDAIRAGNPDLNVFAPDRRMIRSLFAKGMIDRDGPMPRLTEEGEDVAGQIKAHPRRRTFHIAEADDTRTLRVQPRADLDGHLPYPLFVGKDGSVGRQDFWNGKPERVIGFAPSADIQELPVRWADAWETPERAVGLYPVVEYKGGTWFTWDSPVESVTVVGAERPGEERTA